jgi:hypothetical protein
VVVVFRSAPALTIMTIDDARAIYIAFGGLGVGVLATALVCYFSVRNYFAPYLNEKAKNLATREDIAGLTREVEAVRAEFNLIMEERRARHQLRLAGIDKRLEAHQEAFSLWRDLFRSMHSAGVNDETRKCEKWWERNCMYLETEVRTAFSAAFSAAHGHASLLQNRADSELAKENWSVIMAFPKVLFEAIHLPGLSEREFKALEGCDG